MPLLKLWNTLRGRSATDAQATESNVGPGIDDHSQATAKRSVNAQPEPMSAKQAVARPKPPKSSRFLKRNPHGAICKQLKAMGARRVLEIGIGDGSRTVALIETLDQQVGEPIKHVVIDQFELAGGQVTLKAFHRMVCGLSAKPQVIPEPAVSGLNRAVRTIGTFDAILIDEDPGSDHDSGDAAEFGAALERASHAGTVVLHQIDGRWADWKRPKQRRAA